MGSSFKIQDTNLDITQFKCSQCQQSFTQQDKETNNWDLWFDTSRPVVIEELIQGWNLLRLSLEVNALTHKYEAGQVPYYDEPEKRNKYADYKYFNCPGVAKEVSHA